MAAYRSPKELVVPSHFEASHHYSEARGILAQIEGPFQFSTQFRTSASGTTCKMLFRKGLQLGLKILILGHFKSEIRKISYRVIFFTGTPLKVLSTKSS